MQELIGHVGALVVGATILLILAVIGWRGQHHSVSTEQYSAAKEGLLDFAEVMEEDISNMGAGRTNNTLNDPSGHGAFVGSGGYNMSSWPRSIEFYSWTNRTANINDTTNYANRVEYRWDSTGTSAQVFNPTLNDYETVPTYMIERYVNGSAAGSSIDTLTDIDVKLYNRAGTELTPAMISGNSLLLNQVYTVSVSLRAVSPLGGGTGYRDNSDSALRYEVDQTRWS
ncbi:MAG: hypothetical protein R3330_17200, partial [Saprospiraceae bacterium]|nr:hypothetical protein [Saprospiraceae bacterium]